ncbi:hypothetical protein U1Q18_033091 [Sarracenia purpurea var. burkii]
MVVAVALQTWHQRAKKRIKQNRRSGLTTPMSSMPATPSHHASPLHLLRRYQSEMDSVQTSPRRSNFVDEYWDTDGGSLSASPSHHHHHHQQGDGSTSHHHRIELGFMENYEQPEVHHQVPSSSQVAPLPQHGIDIGGKDFSFGRKTSA